MFKAGGSRVPVILLEMMLTKRPEEMKHSGPLYLTPLKKPKPNLWYSRLPVSVHTVNNFMNSIADDGELTEKETLL